MKNFLITFLALTILLPLQGLCGAQTDARKIKREQQTTRKAIERDSKLLEKNKKEITLQLNQLSNLEKEIGAQSHEIDQLNRAIDTNNASILSTQKQIDSLAVRLVSLKALYTKSVRKMQTLPGNGGPLAYIFAASSFRESMQRARYLRQFNSWRNKREQEIIKASAELSGKNATLASLQLSNRQNLDKLASNQASLKQKQNQTDKLIGKLQKEGGSLQTSITKRRKQLANLESELNRIIEADRRRQQSKAAKEKEKTRQTEKKNQQPSSNTTQKPQTQQPAQTVTDPDRKLTGSFEANKGNLLFPVTGSYRVVRGFGNTNYSSRVQTSHVGVDIQVPAGATARAIFSGEVSNVSHLDGFNTIVVVRHGQYISVYINLASASVKAGQKVNPGQTIGTIATDPADPSHAILQFGLRKDRVELNPLIWVKK